MKNLPVKTISSVVSKGAKLPIKAPVEAGKMIIDAYLDYKKICEIEKTKREYIRSERDVALSRIQAQKEILQQYLSETFKERSLAISKMFNYLDAGIATGDSNLISGAMESIVGIIKESPLKGIEKMMLQLDDPNVDEIEI